MKALVGTYLFCAGHRTGWTTGILVAFSSALLIVSTGCASVEPMASTEAVDPIIVDGDLIEWSGSLEQAGSHPLQLGVRHDESNVYIALQSIDEALLRNVMFGGLTVWFNSTGDRTRTTGVRFPIGLVALSRPVVETDTQPTTVNAEIQPFDEIELVNSLGHRIRWPVNGVPGVEVKSFLEYGEFSYELSIPIERGANGDVAISPGTDGSFGLGIELGMEEQTRIQNGASATQGGAAASSSRGRRGGSRGASVTIDTERSGGFGLEGHFQYWRTVTIPLKRPAGG